MNEWQSLYSSLRCKRFLGSREYQNSLGLWCTCQKGQPFTIGHFQVPKIFTFKTRLSAKTFLLKMTFIFMTMKSHFYINGFALSLALKERLRATWKWPITPRPPGRDSLLWPMRVCAAEQGMVFKVLSLKQGI